MDTDKIMVFRSAVRFHLPGLILHADSRHCNLLSARGLHRSK